jgi:hypothetical protein
MLSRNEDLLLPTLEDPTRLGDRTASVSQQQRIQSSSRSPQAPQAESAQANDDGNIRRVSNAISKAPALASGLLHDATSPLPSVHEHTLDASSDPTENNSAYAETLKGIKNEASGVPFYPGTTFVALHVLLMLHGDCSHITQATAEGQPSYWTFVNHTGPPAQITLSSACLWQRRCRQKTLSTCGRRGLSLCPRRISLRYEKLH